MSFFHFQLIHRWVDQCDQKINKAWRKDYNRGVKPWAGPNMVGANNMVGQNIGWGVHASNSSVYPMTSIINLIVKNLWYAKVRIFVAET